MSELKRRDLLYALEVVKPGLASKEMIEQSTSFAFINNRVVTYNDEISISHPVPGLSLVMEGAIKAEELYRLLSKIKKDEITVEQTDKEILLKAGRAKAGLALQHEIKLPLEDVEVQSKWRTLPDNFTTGLEFTVPSCSKDSSRPVLTCVNVRRDGYMESSDNFRMTRHKLGKIPQSFLLPASTAKSLLGYKIIEIAKGEGWVHFKTDEGTILSCRIFEGSFPNVDPLLDVEGYQLQLPKRLNDVLERAEVFAIQESKDEKVIINLEDNVMKIKAKNPVGWFEEEIKIKYSGKPPLYFAVDPHLLKAIATQLRTCIIGDRRMKFEGDDWVHVVALLSRE